MTYTPPLIYTALLPSFFPVWSVLRFQNELSGWEGPPAQGSQQVGGASCSGSWVGWRVDSPILPKIKLWKNEILTFLDESIVRCFKFLLVLQSLWWQREIAANLKGWLMVDRMSHEMLRCSFS